MDNKKENRKSNIKYMLSEALRLIDHDWMLGEDDKWLMLEQYVKIISDTLKKINEK